MRSRQIMLIRDKVDLILLDIKMPGIDSRTMFSHP